MRRTFLCLAMTALLAACGQQSEGESADDFASRVNGDSATSPPPGSTDGPADPGMPRVAADGRKALAQGVTYHQRGGANSIAIRSDGTFTLVEDGRTTTGKWDWLADGKRLRLEGVTYGPIVLVANGALYRMQNENVPFDDVTPDRMYVPGEGAAQ